LFKNAQARKPRRIFDEIPKGALKCQNLNIDCTFWCNNYGGMAFMKTLPHGKEDRLLLSGTMVGKTLSEGGALPVGFLRPEVVMVLSDEYQGPEGKVETRRHGAATGEVKNE